MAVDSDQRHRRFARIPQTELVADGSEAAQMDKLFRPGTPRGAIPQELPRLPVENGNEVRRMDIPENQQTLMVGHKVRIPDAIRFDRKRLGIFLALNVKQTHHASTRGGQARGEDKEKKGIEIRKFDNNYVISAKNYVIFAGGRNGDNSGSIGRRNTSATDCYDESLTKINITTITGSGDGLSATSLVDHVLISAGSSATMNVYDSSLTKSTPTSLRESKYGAAAITNDDNKAAFIGGKLNSFSGGTYGGASYTTDIYDASLTRSNGPAIPDGYMLRCDIWLQGHVRCGGYLILPLAIVGGMSYSLLHQYDLSFTAQPTVISGIESNTQFVYVSGRAGNYALVYRSDSNKFNILEAV